MLGGLHEAVAVHRDTLVFANDRFAALVGAESARTAGQAAGRRRSSRLRRTSSASTCGALRGNAGARPARSRTAPRVDQTARVELVCTPHRLSGRARAAAHAGRDGAACRRRPRTDHRARPTAWETLDSIGEGVVTTDAGGPHRLHEPGGRAADGRRRARCARQAHHRSHLAAWTRTIAVRSAIRSSSAWRSKTRVTVGRRGLMISRGGETSARSSCPRRRSRTSAVSSSAPSSWCATSARCAA